MGFPGSLDVKESVCNAGGLGSIPGLGRSPVGGHGNPFQYSCLENPSGQRSLAGYSLWGCKELDMTERLSTCTEPWARWGFPGLGRSPGRGHGNPFQYSFLENPHGQSSLAGYSLWGRKELETTERLSTAHGPDTQSGIPRLLSSLPTQNW